MNLKVQIKELAMTVNDGLTSYIAVHNEIFREAATLKSVIKNLLGRGVPMSKLLDQAESLVPLWDSIGLKVEAFRVIHASSLSRDEERYVDLLSRYVGAVQKTVVALVDRQRLANEGTKGGPKNPMTWETHKQREAAYQAAVQEYTAIGQELNAASTIICS